MLADVASRAKGKNHCLSLSVRPSVNGSQQSETDGSNGRPMNESDKRRREEGVTRRVQQCQCPSATNRMNGRVSRR